MVMVAVRVTVIVIYDDEIVEDHQNGIKILLF